MSYQDSAWEPAMTAQEVLLKALSGAWHCFKPADTMG